MGNKNISLNSKNNFNLDLYTNLSCLPPEKIYSDAHCFQLSHPADILNSVFKRVISALEELILLKNGEQKLKLGTSIRNFLDAADNFYDNMFNIILSTKKPTVDKEFRTSREAILGHGYHDGITFSQHTLKESSFISDRNNASKHDNISFNPCEIRYPQSTYHVHGFFIGVLSKDDMMEPHKAFHPLYKGLYTGISYNFLIIKTISLLYFYCKKLNKVLFNNKLSQTTCEQNNNIILPAKIVCLSVQEIFFPDEYTKICGKFEFTKRGSLVIDPTYKTEKCEHTSWHLSNLITVNDRTRHGNSIIPYFRG
ncbi:hypothetical protein SDC9_14445 [bioreactor metagenome]|uniref:Uncharacterized protein n=1 Tax=bioreactor metagenome TaxID=1076179 RepID=A0A644TQK2_9ZZZZ|nr:hypothetical protein [Desulfovibrio desulfuricans]MEA4990695.1 hypothetical protein [Desulfovibrio desulfuricans]